MRTGDGGPAAEVPLDGTVYDLETGKVLVWCPKNNPLRFVLGSLKVCRAAFKVRILTTRGRALFICQTSGALMRHGMRGLSG